MKKYGLKIIAALGFVITAINAEGQNLPLSTVPPKDSLIKYMGTSQAVIGKVYGGKYWDKNELTLLDLGGAYPDQVLTIVIKGENRKKFRQPPESLFKDKTVVVKGVTSIFNGKLQMIVSDTSQIVLTGRVKSNY